MECTINILGPLLDLWKIPTLKTQNYTYPAHGYIDRNTAQVSELQKIQNISPLVHQIKKKRIPQNNPNSNAAYEV